MALNLKGHGFAMSFVQLGSFCLTQEMAQKVGALELLTETCSSLKIYSNCNDKILSLLEIIQPE